MFFVLYLLKAFCITVISNYADKKNCIINLVWVHTGEKCKKIILICIVLYTLNSLNDDRSVALNLFLGTYTYSMMYLLVKFLL